MGGGDAEGGEGWPPVGTSGGHGATGWVSDAFGKEAQLQHPWKQSESQPLCLRPT